MFCNKSINHSNKSFLFCRRRWTATPWCHLFLINWQTTPISPRGPRSMRRLRMMRGPRRKQWRYSREPCFIQSVYQSCKQEISTYSTLCTVQLHMNSCSYKPAKPHYITGSLTDVPLLFVLLWYFWGTVQTQATYFVSLCLPWTLLVFVKNSKGQTIVDTALLKFYYKYYFFSLFALHSLQKMSNAYCLSNLLIEKYSVLLVKSFS